MPLNKEPLPLEADPQSVRLAREWVSDVLGNLGREDLIDAAELGVSELVTNAILHAEGPITVRVRGTRTHPRVEVRDQSSHPPEVNVEMTDDDHLMSTIGRGLGIVALYSSTWGSEIAPDGKTVWFEPAAELRDNPDEAALAGTVFEVEEPVESVEAAEQAGELVRVTLLDLPVQVFAQFRRRYRELRRELRLLALSHGDDYPVTREFTELFTEIERERRRSRGIDKLDEATQSGLDRIDLDLFVPPTTPPSMARMADLLEKADQFCREQRLLMLAAPPQQLAVQRWYFGEFSRQAAGEEPAPWPGSFTVEPTAYPLT
jgi:anti-sigma regulatory factor (Ser/Thr protein kinase)